MLVRLKNILKQLNRRKDPNIEPRTIKRETSDAIETKITYQYPKNKSFRFPMPVDEPAIHNRERRRTRKEKVINHNNDASEKEIENRKPFKASEVPSPIHGYQTIDRESSKSLEKPAFLRRDRNERLKNREEKSKKDNVQIKKQSTVKDFRRSRREQSLKEKESDDLTSQRENKSNDQQKIRTDRPRTRTNKRHQQHDRNQQTEQKKNLPQLDLLNDQTGQTIFDRDWIEQQSKMLTETLAEFNVKAKVINARQGPTVTQFEVQPESGVKVSKIRNLSDDIKLNMAAKDIRIEAPIPGKNAVGIEIPNKVASPVGLAEIFKAKEFSQESSPLTIALGLDISGRPIVTNIKKMPHGLIAGATGSGKSVCINTILTSLIFKATPRDVRFLLIDPKMVELASYNDIPHLVAPVITDVKAATQALKWAVAEMEDRYQKFVETGARDIETYNQKLLKEDPSAEKMPYLVIIIDELADLMMMAPQDVEDSISRIAQKARACGIHLLLATQRPSVDVITGLIKANIPTRIAFSVASQVDSRTIIDQAGADRLLGKGDMLFVENGARHPLRIQGAFVSDEEIERVTDDAKKREKVQYLFQQDDLLEKVEQMENEDELYDEVVDFVIDHNSASTSLLQRRFKIGYNRAARMMDSLEENQIITGQNGSKPRKVLVSKEE